MAVRKNKIPNIQESDKKRFMSKVNVGSGCWQWTGSTSPNNQYGRFSISGKAYGPHCISWTIFRGPIPNGYLVRHSCDNQQCVNPDHLSLGVDADNKKDSILRGRARYSYGEYTMDKPKLNAFDISTIRSMYPSSSQLELASLFRVHQSVISRVINKKRGYK